MNEAVPDPKEPFMMANFNEVAQLVQVRGNRTGFWVAFSYMEPIRAGLANLLEPESFFLVSSRAHIWLDTPEITNTIS